SAAASSPCEQTNSPVRGAGAGAASSTRGAATAWLRVVIWALDAEAADAEYCGPALLPTRVIAGHCIRVLGAPERATWIRIRGLRTAHLRCTQQRSGNDKKHDDRCAHCCFSPCRRFLSWFSLASHIISVLPKWRNPPGLR